MADKTPVIQWRRVSRGEPCPICGRPDWCTMGSDGVGTNLVRCTRVKSGIVSHGSDGSLAWLHDNPETPRVLPPSRPPKPPPDKLDRSMIEDIWVKSRNDPDRLERGLKQEAERLNLDWQILDMMGVGIGYDKGGPHTLWPCFDGNIEIVGFLRRYPSGKKLTYPGTTQGVFLPCHDFKNIHYTKILPHTLHVVEGPTDVAAITQAGNVSIGRPSNTGGASIIAQIAFSRSIRNIVVWTENDFREPCPIKCDGPHCQACWPGLYGAYHVATQLRSELPEFHEVHILRLPEGIKDVRDFVVKSGATIHPALDQGKPDFQSNPDFQEWKVEWGKADKDLSVIVTAAYKAIHNQFGTSGQSEQKIWMPENS